MGPGVGYRPLMASIRPPSYDGSGIVNLVARIERAATGSSPSPDLERSLAAQIPEAHTTVLVLFDGLGTHQLDHPLARTLRAAHVGDLDAPFPTTTTVSLATVATGSNPIDHGLIAYQLWVPEVGQVVNTIHMTTMWGDAVDLEHRSFLPTPNLWERLSAAGTEPVTVQPAHFDRTPLTLSLYRGARFVPYATPDEAVERTVTEATVPGRFVFLYLPYIDFAAHVAGQSSDAYAEAMAVADDVWSRLVGELPVGVALVATADHGHVDVDEPCKVRLTRDQEDGLTLYGDARAMFVRGDGASLAADLPAEWLPIDAIRDLWGPGDGTAAFHDRRPDGVLFAHEGHAVFHRRSNDRLVGHHGGLSDAERVVPLLARV